jgi:hypothetical protein
MKVLFVSTFSVAIKDVSFIPRVGDTVALFYMPLPTVTQVVVCVDENMCNTIFDSVLREGSTIPNFPKDFSKIDAVVML